MFDHICINRQDPFGMGIDLGFFAEALVFYQRVNIVADPEMFKVLIRVCGYDVILEMLQMGALNIEFIENIPVVEEHTRLTPYKLYDFRLVAVAQLKLQHLAPQLLQDLTGKSGKGRRMANRLARFVHPIESDVSLTVEAREDITDDTYVENLARTLLRYFAPDYALPEPCVFRFHKDFEGYRLETNIDFDAANASFRHSMGATDATLTPGYVLSYVIGTRRDLKRAAEFSTDLAVSEPVSLVARRKLETLIAGRVGNDRAVSAFEELVFSESKCIREAVNGGSRNFDDVLRLIKRGVKFKEWLKKSPADADLAKEYLREVTKVDWADKLPPKTARWAIFAAAGAVAGFVLNPVAGVAVGTGLSAGDTFLMDKLIKGWKPNQFVNGPLQDFIKR